MRKYIILFFSVLLFLCACSKGVPDGIINKDEMISLLMDVHTVDGTLLNMSQAPDTLYKYGRGRYQAIFEKYHTDSTQFRKSYNYYASKPEQLTVMYDTVLNKLQRKTDSIRKTLGKQINSRPKPVSNPEPPTQPYKGGATPAVKLPHGPLFHGQPLNSRSSFERKQAYKDSILNAINKMKNHKNALPAK